MIKRESWGELIENDSIYNSLCRDRDNSPSNEIPLILPWWGWWGKTNPQMGEYFLGWQNLYFAQLDFCFVNICISVTRQIHRKLNSGIFLFLSDPGIPGVRSMGPSVWNSLREVVETIQVIQVKQVIDSIQVIQPARWER